MPGPYHLPMPPPAPEEHGLDAIATADRVARAAVLWLRREVLHGVASAPGTQAHRELSAGLIARLGERLGLDRSQILLAGYAAALLQAETDMAMDLPLRINAGPGTADYARGVAAAESLFLMLSGTQPIAELLPGNA
jgi:hypothetical protein